MAHNYSNTASTAQLDAPLNSSLGVFQVTGLTGYPAAPFFILMDRDTSSAELMEVTQVAGSTLTVTRGAGGTASTSHASGATVEHVIPAAVPQAVEAHTEATTSVHGVTGALVGADDATTLTNKVYRGAGRHVYSDTLPAAPAAGFIVEADTSISRDGFVAAGVSANVDRAGFLLTQSGADRFKVRYDGSVQVTPSGVSSHPAIETTGNVTTEDLTVNDDATVGGTLSVLTDFSSQTVTTANANISSGLAVTGTSALAQVNASGTVTAAGGGTGLAVTNNATVGGSVSVAGTGTSLILSGSNGRLRFPSSPTAATPGSAAGEVRYRARGVESWDGTSWYHPGITGSTSTGGASGGVGLRATIASAPITGPASSAPYYIMAQGQCEMNDPGTGARWDLFVRLDDDEGDNIAIGVGNGFILTGMGCTPRLTGNHTVYFVVERTLGSGTGTLTAFNQMFTVMQVGTTEAA